jgi:glycosyltransferase involved in cell wall biosynthesis
MTSQKSRVLWVSFDFPPRQSSAVYRPIKIYKYLDKDAFEVDFLTQSLSFKQKQAVLDETLMDEVSPRPRVHKVPNFVLHDWIFSLSRRRKNRSKNLGRPESPRDLLQAGKVSSLETKAAERPGLAKTLYGHWVMLGYFPDQYFLWGWLTALRALGLHLIRRYDLIYTTSYPESCHLPGLLLKALGVRWVADYRYGGPLWIRKILNYHKSSWRERREFRFQKRVVERADTVVTQSDSIKADFCRAFALDPAKLRTIPSGFDESDFVDTPGTAPFPRFAPFAKNEREIHMIHAGAAYLSRDDRAKLVAEMNVLGDAIEKREGRRLVVHALGDDLFGEPSRRNELRFGYLFHGVVPHPELPAYLHAADWYLLSTLTSVAESSVINGYLPSKMWEYMRGGKPIVHYGPHDEVWSILEEAGAAVYMGALENGHRMGADRLLAATRTIVPNPSRIAQHSWQSRARAMQLVFTELTETNGRKRGP